MVAWGEHLHAACGSSSICGGHTDALFVMLDPASGVGRKVLFIRGETESSLCHRCSDGTGDTCCSDSHTWRTIAAMRTSL